MQEYKVSILVEDEYIVTVKAKNEEEAIEIAETMQADSEASWVNGCVNSEIINSEIIN